MTAVWASPDEVSRLVAKRCEAHEAAHQANTTAKWRIEVGPQFRQHLQRQEIRDYPGWGYTPEGHFLLWRIPIVPVEGPEGWRLMEQP